MGGLPTELVYHTAHYLEPRELDLLSRSGTIGNKASKRVLEWYISHIGKVVTYSNRNILIYAVVNDPEDGGMKFLYVTVTGNDHMVYSELTENEIKDYDFRPGSPKLPYYELFNEISEAIADIMPRKVVREDLGRYIKGRIARRLMKKYVLIHSELPLITFLSELDEIDFQYFGGHRLYAGYDYVLFKARDLPVPVSEWHREYVSKAPTNKRFNKLSDRLFISQTHLHSELADRNIATNMVTQRPDHRRV